MGRRNTKRGRGSKSSVKQTIVNPESTEGLTDNLDSYENLDLLYDFTKDIIDKQYRSYVWNDGKVQSLVTIDAAVIAGILLLAQTFKNMAVYSLVLLGLSFATLIISFVICLIHSIPKIHSGVGNESNLRTMIGISQHSKVQYLEHIKKLRKSDIIKMNAWQITGMCKNNLRSRRLIRAGVFLTIAGVLILSICIPFVVYESINYQKSDIKSDLKDTTKVSLTVPTKISVKDSLSIMPVK